ncbi:MAG: 3-methyl-2-oxobutanoate hydroxymethyltransferase [Leptospirales bacterium]
MTEYQYILALGSNLGDRKKTIERAIELIETKVGRIIKQSPFVKTPPSIEKRQPPFINSGVSIESRMNPANLMEALKTVETELGRKRRFKFGPREIDIDIVWWSGGKYRDGNLSIPHIYNNARPWVRNILALLHPEGRQSHRKITTMNVTAIRSVSDFKKKKELGEKIAMVTCYDFSSAKILSRTSVDTILVGDSLGNVIAGYENTLPVTLENMIYHSAAVRRGHPDAFITVDMPFLSYQISVEEAVRNAGEVILKTGAQAVKLEGGRDFIDVIKAIRRASIPVMAHLGLQPQSILELEGYKVQAKEQKEADQLLDEAKMLEEAGVFALVLEMVPTTLAKRVSQELKIPVIGIGAGPDVDGQVLVLNDILGYNPDFSPRFVRKYVDLASQISTAVEQYSEDVRNKDFPAENEYFE